MTLSIMESDIPKEVRNMGNAQILYSVKAQRGPVLRCKGWRQETILRMLENNMENAEHPERLVIYGGNGSVRELGILPCHREILEGTRGRRDAVVQSGMPVAVFKTHKYAPVVVMATDEHHEGHVARLLRAEAKNLTIFAQYTAAPWSTSEPRSYRGNLRDSWSGGHQALRRFPERPDLLTAGGVEWAATRAGP
jgi:urocanate hydratase